MEAIWRKPLEGWTQFQKSRENVRSVRGMTAYTGVTEAQKCHLIASIIHPMDESCLLVTYDELQANRLLDDLKLFLPDKLVLFPAREMMLYHAAAHSQEVTGRRHAVLEELISGDKIMIVTYIDALL